jgi:ABC-type lipoprotein export system ATPase subunit
VNLRQRCKGKVNILTIPSQNDTAPATPLRRDVKPLIETRGLSRSYDKEKIFALRDAHLRIFGGEYLAIVGPSGSGKSTLLHLLGGLDKPSSGEIYFEQKPLNSISDLAAFRARTIGFIFQSFHLLPTLTAIENVQIPMFEMNWRASLRQKRAQELLQRVGLADRLHQLPAQLSGGERQRVAIARSLANEPKVLLADEPTGNLDSATALATIELLENLRSEQGATLVIVTHDSEIASRVQRKIRLHDGRVIEDTANPLS